MSNLHRRSSLSTLRLLCVLALAPLGWGLTACAAEGVEADCPEMPVTDDPFDPELAEWRKNAEEMGCVTPHGGPIQ